MKIEEGNYYVNRLGEKVGPIAWNIDPSYPWRTQDGNIFTIDGHYWKGIQEDYRDLIAEWTDPAAEWGEWGSWSDCETVIRSGGDFQSEKISGDTRYRVRKPNPAPVVRTIVGYASFSAPVYHTAVTVDMIDGKPDWTTLKAVQS